MRHKLSQEARTDLAELHLFGTIRYGEDQADRYVLQLMDEFARIADMPRAHPERHEVRPPVRMRSFMGHNIFYDVVAGGVIIVRVLHHSADWMHTL